MGLRSRFLMGAVPTRSSEPSCSRLSRTLCAAEAAARRRAVLDSRLRAPTRAPRRSGRKDGPQSNKRMDFPKALPARCIDYGKRKSPLRNRSAHQFGKCLFCLLSQLQSHFVLHFIGPHFPRLELGLTQTISPLLSPISTKQ